MKTYLILINNAYKMGRAHIALGNALKNKGNKVIYAFTDYLVFYTENLNLNNEKYYVFADFFQQNYNKKTIQPQYLGLNINKLYFSDYDRNTIHGHMKTIKLDKYDSLMSNLINFFDYIYTNNQVDICIYESISNSFAYTAYEVGKLNNVKYCGYGGCRLKDRFELYTEEYGQIELFSKTYQNVQLEKLDQETRNFIDKYLDSYQTGTKIPSYHPTDKSFSWKFSLFERYFNKDKIRLITGSIKFIFYHHNQIKFSYQIGNPLFELWKNFYKQLQKKYRTQIGIKYFDKPNYNEKYFLYPQHFKPESSTSVLARHYCDDLAVIQNIAFNLPSNAKLYVKEHFVNYGRMSLDYYRDIRKLPNVKLIFCDENIKDLIQFSQGVITLTSTVGFEALMMNKPVFVFGNVFYQCHPNCRKLYSYENLFDSLKDLSVSLDRQINRNFIGAYYKTTFKGCIYYWIGKKFSLSNFSNIFINAINERFN